MITDMEIRHARVLAVLDVLRRRVADARYQPGDRFLSARAVAQRHGVSYQTAHRLLRTLVDEALLERRGRSGTYIARRRRPLAEVVLIFHARARHEGSFGQRLVRELIAGAGRFGLERVTVAFDPQARPGADQFPVLWERPDALAWCVRQRRGALLINDRPRPSLAAMGIDSVSMDDFAGGVAAAGHLAQRVGVNRRYCVLAGPRRDRRSRERVAGFTSELEARVYYASSWFAAAADAVAPRVLRSEPAGVFCCNDRLAQGLLAAADRLGLAAPPVVGFDDAPVAARLKLTTVAIPWPELIDGVLQRVRARVDGERGPASHLLLYPQLVQRSG